MRKLLGIFAFLIFFFSILFSYGCAARQVRLNEVKCKNPGEVVFIVNTHESAWIDFDGVKVRRMAIRMCGKDHTLKEFDPPLFGFWLNHYFELWAGKWIPSKEDPMRGRYRYRNIARFYGLYSKTKAYQQAEDFIQLLIKRDK